MKSALRYLKENWLKGVFTLILISWIVNIVAEPFGLLILIATVLLVLVASFLSKKVFKLDRKGPIPWYGSPLFWVSIAFLLAWGFRHISNT